MTKKSNEKLYQKDLQNHQLWKQKPEEWKNKKKMTDIEFYRQNQTIEKEKLKLQEEMVRLKQKQKSNLLKHGANMTDKDYVWDIVKNREPKNSETEYPLSDLRHTFSCFQKAKSRHLTNNCQSPTQESTILRSPMSKYNYLSCDQDNNPYKKARNNSGDYIIDEKSSQFLSNHPRVIGKSSSGYSQIESQKKENYARSRERIFSSGVWSPKTDSSMRKIDEINYIENYMR